MCARAPERCFVRETPAVPNRPLGTSGPGKRYCHVPPGELTDTVRGKCRAVGIRLVISTGEHINQAKVVTINTFGEVPGFVPLGHPPRERGLIENGIGK